MKNLILTLVLGASTLLINNGANAKTSCPYSGQKVVSIAEINTILERLPDGWTYEEDENPRYRLNAGTQFDANDPELSVLGPVGKPIKKLGKQYIDCAYTIRFLATANPMAGTHTVGKFSISSA